MKNIKQFVGDKEQLSNNRVYFSVAIRHETCPRDSITEIITTCVSLTFD